MAIEIKYEAANHVGKEVIFIHFVKNAELNQRIKKLIGVKWSSSRKAWYVNDNNYYRALFKITNKLKVGKEVLSHIDEINQPALSKMVEILQLKAYSKNTINTYRNEFAQLLYALKERNVDELDAERLRSYFLYCVNELKLSENTLNSRINAVKFYFEVVIKREKFFFEIPRPKKPSILPKVLSANDIKKIFEATTNLKHNTMLKICYGMGLRVSEIVKLKIKDIDSERMQAFIERAKGKKDRYVNLPESILEQLRSYYLEFKPKDYLFEGQYGGEYSIRSAQKVFTDALKKAKINKTIGIHGLRHSFATHLMENGTDAIFIQKLLGHNDIKTTLKYIHVSKKDVKNIKSPLDSIGN